MLKYIWIVRNPIPGSTLNDILWRQDAEDLGDYCVGAGPGTWRNECHSVYTTEAEAKKDAEARLRAVAKGLHLVRRSDGRVVGISIPK